MTSILRYRENVIGACGYLTSVDGKKWIFNQIGAQCLKIAQKCLILHHCERSGQTLFQISFEKNGFLFFILSRKFKWDIFYYFLNTVSKINFQ